MRSRTYDLIFLAAATIITTFLVWLPFLLRLPSFWGIKLRQDGMATIVANFDGPYYLVAAKTLYNPKEIEQNFSFPLLPIYYSAHYPLFPLLIRLTVTIFPFLTYPYAMILVTLVTSVLAIWSVYFFLRLVGLGKNSLWLALVFTVLPGRWLVTRSVGSPEPLFIATVVTSLYFFIRQNYYLAGFFGALAQATKPPGTLLFLAYVVAIAISYWGRLAHTNFLSWLKGLPWKTYPLLLIPITLLSIFAFYRWRYGSFLAYFSSGDNIHLMFPPFQVFNPEQVWVGTFWLEEIIWIYIFGLLGFVYLIKQRQYKVAAFVGIFFLSIFFVSHRDIARYSLPIVPFLLVAFNKVIASKEFRWVILILLLPIYLYSITFINNNVTPISDWTQLL
jgi:hypothetical protein